jgi:hypothetical protein
MPAAHAPSHCCMHAPLHRDNDESLRLGGFNMATYYKPGVPLCDLVGTLDYLAPEVFSNSYSCQVGVGCCMLQLVAGAGLGAGCWVVLAARLHMGSTCKLGVQQQPAAGLSSRCCCRRRCRCMCRRRRSACRVSFLLST